jgi:uncharacterized protein YbdZ (MbtH family)
MPCCEARHFVFIQRKYFQTLTRSQNAIKVANYFTLYILKQIKMEEQCKVIVNADGVHGIITAGTPDPEGWQDAGKEGSLEECQAFIEEIEAQ